MKPLLAISAAVVALSAVILSEAKDLLFSP
jgi:hypothetical protein